jgi:predicted metal-dependent hydrolase
MARHSAAEWRTLVSGVCLTSLGSTGLLWYSRAEWVAEGEENRQENARTVNDLQDDMRTMRDELHFSQTRTDLLTTHRLLALASRALQQQNVDDAQARLSQASTFVRAVNSHYSGVDAQRLDRFKQELVAADVKQARSPEQVTDRLRQLTKELDALLGE